METVRYIVGLLLVVTFPPAVAFWFLVHPFAKQWRSVGARWAYAVAIAGMFVMIGGLFVIREVLMGRDLGFSRVLLVVGLAIYAGAIVIEILCRKHLTFRILTGVPELSKEGPGRLLTGGIYGRIRHPRYVGVVLSGVGWAMIANYSGAYLVVAALFPAVHLLTVIEERELLDRFGAGYAAYRERVPRFLPSWGASGVSGDG